MLKLEDLRPGDRLELLIPAGKVDPWTQAKTKKARRYRMEVVTVEPDRVRLRDLDGGGYPPEGFSIGPTYWASLVAPHVVGREARHDATAAPR